MTRRMCGPGSRVWIVTLGMISSFAIPFMTFPAQADSFNLKPGMWEMTVTTAASGLTVPPDVLDKMPPERRAKIEETMQARGAQPRSFTSKECVTQKDLDENRIIKDAEESEGHSARCTTKVVSKSSSKLVIERTCLAPQASTSRITMEAKTRETLIASVDMTGNRTGKVHVDMNGRWLGATCTGGRN